MAKLTIEDLLAVKERPSYEKTTVFLPSLGGELEVVKIPLARYMRMISEAASDDAEKSLYAQYDLIYACCPLLHDAQLQEAYACHEPSEIVPKVLQENLGDLNTLTVAITGMYGVNAEGLLKN